MARYDQFRELLLHLEAAVIGGQSHFHIPSLTVSLMPGDLALRRSHNGFNVETKLLQQLLQRRRSSKAFDANIVAFRARILAPAEVRCLFHRYAGLHCGRQDGFPVAPVLVIKQLPRRHADNTRSDALFG